MNSYLNNYQSKLNQAAAINYFYHPLFGSLKDSKGKPLGDNDTKILSEYCNSQLNIFLQEEGFEMELEREKVESTKMAKANPNESTIYWQNRIKRKRELYDFLAQTILWFTHLLYFQSTSFGDVISVLTAREELKAVVEGGALVTSGLTLNECFQKAKQVFMPLKKQLQKMVDTEYPI